MSYQSCRDAAVTQLRSVAGFGAVNVTAGDWSFLNSGPDRGIVVMFDRMEHRRSGMGRREIDWVLQLHLVEKLLPNAQAAEIVFATDIQAIIDRIDAYPRLNAAAGVLDAHLMEASDTGEDITFGSTRYVHYGLILKITEEGSAGYLE